MDILREFSVRRRQIRRILYGMTAAAMVGIVTVGLSRLEPAVPSVDQTTVWMGTVKRGLMLRQVRGPGTLVPKEIRWVSAVTEGWVERVRLLPGTKVKADTVLLELSNPKLEQATLDVQWQLEAAEADYENLKVQLESELLDQRAATATVEADYHQAKLKFEIDKELAELGLISNLDFKESELKTRELANQHEINNKRIAMSAESIKAQLAAQRARIEQLRTLLRLKQKQVSSLQVRSGIKGVLQQLPIEVGQQVTAGSILAKVTQPSRLKAELKIAETQAKDLQHGQKTSIDTRNGVIPGHVIRIAPAVDEGTVTVDVALDGPLPKGARPDLSVDGTIEIERLEDVLYVGRPTFGQADSMVGLFKLVNGNKDAVRIQVKLGRNSVNTVEIREGLEEGDKVILSDMSRWEAFNRIRLH